jgi:hypothetical protein
VARAITSGEHDAVRARNHHYLGPIGDADQIRRLTTGADLKDHRDPIGPVDVAAVEPQLIPFPSFYDQSPSLV